LHHQQAKAYLLSKPASIEDFPFGTDVSVFKVKGKMFATLALGKMGKDQSDGGKQWWMNLKCDPAEALILRDIFPAVIPGYHMNKLHWNTVILDCSIPQGEIERMIDNSYLLVVSTLNKKEQQSLLLHL
jgi:predicted DNA-binding protein (MmcQ/YjbR family)